IGNTRSSRRARRSRAEQVGSRAKPGCDDAARREFRPCEFSETMDLDVGTAGTPELVCKPGANGVSLRVGLGVWTGLRTIERFEEEARSMIRRAVLAMIVTAAPVAAQSASRDSVSRWVDSIFAPYASAASPGCAVGVVQKGALALAKGYGMADL